MKVMLNTKTKKTLKPHQEFLDTCNISGNVVLSLFSETYINIFVFDYAQLPKNEKKNVQKTISIDIKDQGDLGEGSYV